MPTSLTQVTAFLSSPGDLPGQRQIIAEVCNEINHDLGAIKGFSIRLLTWEEDTHPAAGESAQGVINSQIPSNYDIFIGMLGNRFGTPTKKWRSGTEEEFRVAFDRLSKGGSVEIMFYFLDRPETVSRLDFDQAKLVQDFKKEIASLGVYYSTFPDDTSLRIRIRTHLIKVVLSIVENAAPAPPTIDVGSDSPLELNPLGNYQRLLDDDQQVRAYVLIVEATGFMEQFTVRMGLLTTQTRQLTSILAREQKKLVGKKSSLVQMLQAHLDAGRVVQRALANYEAQLRNAVPTLDAAVDGALTRLHRYIGLVQARAGGLEEVKAQIVVPLGNFSREMSAVKQTVKLVGQVLGTIGTASNSELAKIISALLSDFEAFADRTLVTIEDIQREFSARSIENNDILKLAPEV